jgi:hypothetical protein
MTDAAEQTMWEELKALLRALGAIFGDPARLCGEGVLPRGEALSLRGWLAALEAIARAFLLVMAARLPRSEPRPARTVRAAADAERAGPGAAEAPDPAAEAPDAEMTDSERWAGVAFRVLPAPSAPSGPRAPLQRFVGGRSLAYRFEALIRVAEAPEAYARRLARRLYASPALVARVLEPPGRRSGERAPPWGDLREEARARALAAAAAFDTG